MIKKLKLYSKSTSSIFILIFIIIVLSSWYFINQSRILIDKTSPVSNTLGGNIQTERDFWTKRLKEVGASKAYTEFKQRYQDKDVSTQHLVAHLFGELLYKKEGLKGITICDSSFSFGCFHSFFSQAITDKGSNVIIPLYDACIKKYGPLGTGCQHGIGHGILEYLGHDKLVDALHSCEPIQKLKFLGCTPGVFMEYNFPALIGQNTATVTRRDIDAYHPLAPCPDLPEKFRESCYFELPQWLSVVFEYDYQKIGNLCADITTNVEEREACFKGIGYYISPQSQYNTEKAIENCKKMPDSQSNLFCLAGASWGFFAVPEYKSKAQDLCAPLGENRETCLKKADLTSEKSSF